MTDSARLKKLARQYMQDHPGVRYQQALAAVGATATAPPTEHDWLRLVGGFPSREALADRWSTTLTSHHLRWPVGTRPALGGAAQPLWVDLVQPSLGGDGTHAAILGWGSDTHRVVETMLISLAAWHGPERLRFVVAGFPAGRVANLPHCVAEDRGPIDWQPAALLRQEIERREQELRRTHCRDIYDHRDHAVEIGVAALPDLLVVLADVDELMDAHHPVAAVIEDVARKGRSLGMHLVVSAKSASSTSSQAWWRLAPEFEVLLLGPASSGWPLSADLPSPADPAPPGAGRLWTAHQPKCQQAAPVQIFPDPKSEDTQSLCRLISSSLHAPKAGGAAGVREERIWAEAGDWRCGDGPYLIVQSGLYDNGVLLDSPLTIASFPLRDGGDRQEIDGALAAVGFCADWERPVEGTDYGIAFVVTPI